MKRPSLEQHSGSPWPGAALSVRKARGAATAAPLVAMLLSACTLLSDFAVHQCELDADCEVPAGATSHCQMGHCVEGCRNNRQCSALDPRSPLCFAEGGECIAITRSDGQCYISSEYHDATMGDSTVDGMTIIGAFASSLRSSTWLTLELAAGDFREAATRAGDGLEPLMVVLCDDAPQAIEGAMSELIDGLGARAIVASFDGAAQPAGLLAAGSRAFLLDPDGTLASPPNPDYWHLGGDYALLAPVYSSLLDAVGPRLNERAIPSGRPSRIAAVAGPGESGRVAALAAAALRLDGADTAQLEIADRYRSFELSDVERDAIGDALIAFEPDLVLWHASGTFGSLPRAERAELITRLDEAAAANGRALPLYVLGPRRAGDFHLDARASANPSFRARAVWSDLEFVEETDAALRAAFYAAYPSLPTAPSIGPAARIYDSLYLLALAAASVDAFGTSESFHAGLSRVTDPAGPSVRAGRGSDELALARELLGRRVPFALHGASGFGPFDLERGVRAAAPVLRCWGDDGLPVVSVRWDSASGSLRRVGPSCAAEVIDALFE